MIIKMFTFGMYLTNCYVVGCEETKEAIVIDPGFDRDREAEERRSHLRYPINNRTSDYTRRK